MKTAAFPLTLSAFMLSLAIYALSEELYYVGTKTCAECHSREDLGNQYAIWQASPHARAYRLLYTERAGEIARKNDIETPAESIECLRCHTTGGGRYENFENEGVGCESCHGPGSRYHDSSVHIDYADRRKAYARAIEEGMYPILGDAHLANRERLCLSCHNSERPCIPETRSGLLRKRMTIQTVDTLIRGDVNLQHPLRR